MLKPKPVKFRISLWKMFYNLSDNNQIPKSGLNFLTSLKVDKNFLLLCGLKNLEIFLLELTFLKNYFENY